jgi:hypothetical protein
MSVDECDVLSATLALFTFAVTGTIFLKTNIYLSGIDGLRRPF